MKLEKSRFDWLMDIVVVLLFAGTGIYLLMTWNDIPSQIAGHFNAAGEIDKMSNKSSVWILYLVGLILVGSLTLIGHFPQIWNTGVEVNEENRIRVYRTLKNMLMTMRLVLAVTFSALIFFTVTGEALPAFALPFFLLLIIGSMACFLIRLYRVAKP